jgi:hypothetical protein
MGRKMAGTTHLCRLSLLGKKHQILMDAELVRGSLTRKDFLSKLVTERVTQLVLLNGHINQW